MCYNKALLGNHEPSSGSPGGPQQKLCVQMVNISKKIVKTEKRKNAQAI